MSISLGLESRIGDMIFFNRDYLNWKQLPDGTSVLVTKDVKCIFPLSKIRVVEDTIEGSEKKHYFLVDEYGDSIQIYTEDDYLDKVREQLEYMLEVALCG